MVAIDHKESEQLELNESFAAGTMLGKRFIDGKTGLEILCTVGGEGTLSIEGVPLSARDSKGLPSSD